MTTPRKPRVFFDGDTVPAGVWTYRVEKAGSDEAIEMLDTYEGCANGNLGPLLEIVIPDDADQVILTAARERGIKVDYCTQCQEWIDIKVRNGADTACHDCAELADAPVQA